MGSFFGSGSKGPIGSDALNGANGKLSELK
jgi:hypothetical protein